MQQNGLLHTFDGPQSVDGGVDQLGQGFIKHRTMSEHPASRTRMFNTEAGPGFQAQMSQMAQMPQYVRPEVTVNFPPSEVVKKFKAHDGGAQCITFSFDGRKIITAGMDGMVKQWETTNTVDNHYLSLGRDRASCCAISQSGQ